MNARLTLSAYSTYSYLNLHIYSDANKDIIVRLFNDEVKMVRMFTWYVLKGENNKVLNQQGAIEEKWCLLDIVDFGGSVLFSTKISS